MEQAYSHLSHGHCLLWNATEGVELTNQPLQLWECPTERTDPALQDQSRSGAPGKASAEEEVVQEVKAARTGLTAQQCQREGRKGSCLQSRLLPTLCPFLGPGSQEGHKL
jgi:hypothetical protein